jgi:hypothetical protein
MNHSAAPCDNCGAANIAIVPSDLAPSGRPIFRIECPVCGQVSEKVIPAANVLGIIADPEKAPQRVDFCHPPLLPVRIEAEGTTV